MGRTGDRSGRSPNSNIFDAIPLTTPPGFRGGQVIVINASEYGVDRNIWRYWSHSTCFTPDVDLEIITELSNDIVLKGPVNVQNAQRRSYSSHYLIPALRIVWNDILSISSIKIHIPSAQTLVLKQIDIEICGILPDL